MESCEEEEADQWENWTPSVLHHMEQGAAQDSLRQRVKLVNVPIALSIGQTPTQVICMVQTLSGASLSVVKSLFVLFLTFSSFFSWQVPSEDGTRMSLSMSFPEEPKIEKAAAEGDMVEGFDEFFSPIVRSIVFPDGIKVDPSSKMMVYDRADGIVTIKFEKN
jgi:hypothetical protein